MFQGRKDDYMHSEAAVTAMTLRFMGMVVGALWVAIWSPLSR